MNDKQKPPEKQKDRAPTDLSRRSFVRKLWWIVGGVALAEFLLVTLDFIRPHKQEPGRAESDIVVAGPMNLFEPDTVTAFPSGKFYLARLKDGGFLALSRRCTHLGCTVPWDSARGRFICPCHASVFDITGSVLSPPAPRALDLYPVRIENRIVKVDTSKLIRRRSFDATQPTYA